jgi:rRNA maturation protein Rpf1
MDRLSWKKITYKTLSKKCRDLIKKLQLITNKYYFTRGKE